METKQIILKKLNLRTSPFSPEVGTDDKPILPRLFLRNLDPRKDRRLLKYYFDFYDLKNGKILGGLTPEEGIKNFPLCDEVDHAAPILFLISGTSQTGRSSLINLILFKIEDIFQVVPITVDAVLSSFNKAQNTKELARLFITTYTSEQPKPDSKLLWEIYERETKEDSSGSQTPYSTLFKSLNIFIRKECDRPIVFLIKGCDHYDLWSCTYDSTMGLANYLIVETSKKADAETCHNILTGEQKRVAHIFAPKLKNEQVCKFILDRLSLGRLIPSEKSLVPFTNEAIDILFERNPDTICTEPLEWPIGWVQASLSRVFQEHMDTLCRLVEEKGQAVLDSLPPEKLYVDKNKMWEVRQRMNKGE